MKKGPVKRIACEWSGDCDGNWNTECGEMFIILEGTPEKNKMKFCAYCGKPVTTKTAFDQGDTMKNLHIHRNHWDRGKIVLQKYHLGWDCDEANMYPSKDGDYYLVSDVDQIFKVLYAAPNV